MSEANKAVVDVLLVKVTEMEDGEDERAVIKRIPDFAFTDLSNAKIREKVLFEKHDLVADAGGPEAVEVLISRPFQC